MIDQQDNRSANPVTLGTGTGEQTVSGQQAPNLYELGGSVQVLADGSVESSQNTMKTPMF